MEFEKLLKELNLENNFPKTEVQFKKCILDKNNLSVKFEFLCNNELTGENKSLLEAELQKYLSGLNVKCSFEISNFISVEDVVINTLLEYSPSIRSCIQDIEIVTNESSISITPPKEELYYALTSNGLSEKLREKLLSFKEYKIEFIKPKRKLPM